MTREYLYGWASCRILLSPSGFFFQAEDGIRYTSVTGVQTCALPISWLARPTVPLRICSDDAGRARHFDLPRTIPAGTHRRSEERRVGKECRARWARGHEEKQHENAKAAH